MHIWIRLEVVLLIDNNVVAIVLGHVLSGVDPFLWTGRYDAIRRFGFRILPDSGIRTLILRPKEQKSGR